MPWRYVVKGQQVKAVKKEISRSLRKVMTPEERLLWDVLRDGKLGVKFRRQQVISGFIVDFYCHSLGLIVEADGSQHSPENDCERDGILTAQGLKIFRYKNEIIRENIDQVILDILELLT